MPDTYYVYMETNEWHTVLYTGLTNNLIKRAYQHRQKLIDGFTKKYNVTRLVYYELYPTAWEAIEREKQIKGWRREKKEGLINAMNPEWKDLYDTLDYE
ncbi:MAG: GIY-YIG nuclease family protein [Candidatus Marinimicrobia bacterium]|nr:GIY-YIG nuclease family protein [Candidatus Neomarinimicrobiota bacterium]MCF7828008.1 GIY-YIG nuclease family protein [Candidatus Neomarinimicrobiota bacterium]MCF7879237.1 GIY-YIG nuclease family protein [Candidatus Neomarinimicrobiota bacterium]